MNYQQNQALLDQSLESADDAHEPDQFSEQVLQVQKPPEMPVVARVRGVRGRRRAIDSGRQQSAEAGETVTHNTRGRKPRLVKQQRAKRPTQRQLIKRDTPEWEAFITKLNLIKKKSNREVLCIECWQMLNCKQKIKHLKQFPAHRQYLLTSTQYASEQKICELAQGWNKLIKKPDGEEYMISPFAPLNLPPIENPHAMLTDSSNVPEKQVKQDQFVTEKIVRPDREVQVPVAIEPVTKRRKLDEDPPIDIVIDNPEKRQRLDSNVSKSYEGKLRNELLSQQDEIKNLSKENKQIMAQLKVIESKVELIVRIYQIFMTELPQLKQATAAVTDEGKFREMNRDGRGRSPTVFPQMMKPPMQPMANPQMIQMMPQLQAMSNTPKMDQVAGLMINMLQQGNGKMNDSGPSRTVQQQLLAQLQQLSSNVQKQLQPGQKSAHKKEETPKRRNSNMEKQELILLDNQVKDPAQSMIGNFGQGNIHPMMGMQERRSSIGSIRSIKSGGIVQTKQQQDAAKKADQPRRMQGTDSAHNLNALADSGKQEASGSRSQPPPISQQQNLAQKIVTNTLLAAGQNGMNNHAGGQNQLNQIFNLGQVVMPLGYTHQNPNNQMMGGNSLPYQGQHNFNRFPQNYGKQNQLPGYGGRQEPELMGQSPIFDSNRMIPGQGQSPFLSSLANNGQVQMQGQIGGGPPGMGTYGLQGSMNLTSVFGYGKNGVVGESQFTGGEFANQQNMRLGLPKKGSQNNLIPGLGQEAALSQLGANSNNYTDSQVDSNGQQKRPVGQEMQNGLMKQPSTDPVKRLLGMQRHSPDQVKEDSAQGIAESRAMFQDTLKKSLALDPQAPRVDLDRNYSFAAPMQDPHSGTQRDTSIANEVLKQPEE